MPLHCLYVSQDLPEDHSLGGHSLQLAFLLQPVVCSIIACWLWNCEGKGSVSQEHSSVMWASHCYKFCRLDRLSKQSRAVHEHHAVQNDGPSHRLPQQPPRQQNQASKGHQEFRRRKNADLGSMFRLCSWATSAASATCWRMTAGDWLGKEAGPPIARSMVDK